MLQGDRGLFKKSVGLHNLVTQDPSLVLFALLLLVLFAAARREPPPAQAAELRLLARLALGFVLLLPLALVLLGKFPIYYTWLAHVPAVMIAVRLAVLLAARGWRWPPIVFGVVALVASAWAVAARWPTTRSRPDRPSIGTSARGSAGRCSRMTSSTRTTRPTSPHARARCG